MLNRKIYRHKTQKIIISLRNKSASEFPFPWGDASVTGIHFYMFLAGGDDKESISLLPSNLPTIINVH